MAEAEYPGADLGLPRTGMASVAPYGRRFAALLIDCLLAGAVTWVFTAPEPPLNWSLLSLFLIYTISTAFFGRTPGMTFVGLGLASEIEGQRLGLPKAAIRTILLMLFIPAVVLDQDRRGLHDHVAGTIVVNAR